MKKFLIFNLFVPLIPLCADFRNWSRYYTQFFLSCANSDSYFTHIFYKALSSTIWVILLTYLQYVLSS